MNNRVYLAGGHRSNWQERVKKFPLKDNPDTPEEQVFGPDVLGNHFYFFDPAAKEKGEEKWSLVQYGKWDLHHVKNSDITFVYMERDNPSGIGLASELGYAKGLGKTVILVLEKNHLTQEDRYLDFLRIVADITFDNLEDGMKYLRSFVIV